MDETPVPPKSNVPRFTIDAEVPHEVIRLFEEYLKRQYELPQPLTDLTTTATHPGTSRFLLQPFTRGSHGKYGKVGFWTLKDANSQGEERFAIKENKGLDDTDKVQVTTIEAKVLQALRQRGLPVVDYVSHWKNHLMTRFIDGPTVEDYVLKQGSLDHTIALAMIETMPQIHRALTEIIENPHAQGALTVQEAEYVKARPAEMVGFNFRSVDGDELQRNFHTYRVLQSVMKHIPGFIESYRGINNTLVTARKTWIGYDHPRNRILAQLNERAPYRAVRFDFNHLSNDFFGLDTSQLITAIQPDPDQHPDVFDKQIRAMHQYINLAIILDSLHREDPASRWYKPLESMADEMKDPGKINQTDIKNVYGHEGVVETTARMFGALIHRTTLDLIKAVKNHEDGSQHRAKVCVAALRYINQQSENFSESLSHSQKEMLAIRGVQLPLSVSSILPLVAHEPIAPYIWKSLEAYTPRRQDNS